MAETQPALIHPTTGRPINSAPGLRRMASLSGDYARAFPYDAANVFHRETEGWYPWIYSPDYEYNIYRDRVVGRARDLRRNDGWFAGGVDRILDATVGAHFRFVSMPDYRQLALVSGNSKFDAKWANEFSQVFDSYWRGFADDPNLYCDATRQLNFTQMMRLALAHKIVDGENLVINEWLEDRVGYGAAKFATCFRVVDPDRLSNPYEQIDQLRRRGGVEIDDEGAPIGYHIRQAHQNDWYGAVPSMIWDFVERETDWGRRIVTHDYDRERTDQHRGIPLVAAVMNRMKMLAKYDQVELQAAVLNAALSIFVTSPYDPEGLRDAASGGDEDDAHWYWRSRRIYRDQKPLSFSEANVVAGFPGEDAKPIKAERPGSFHDPFTHYCLRSVAARMGTTAEEMTLDWTKANYSSARAGFVVAWKTLSRRRGEFAAGTAMPCVVAWAEELFERPEFRKAALPANAPDFMEAREAYTRGRFLGPGRGYVDPVKEGQAAILRMDAGFSTLLAECAEQGSDWRENLDQREIEVAEFRARKLPLPTWVGTPLAGPTDDDDDAEPASKTAKKPQPQ